MSNKETYSNASHEVSWPPTSPDDIVDFFLKREQLDMFHGFSRNALAAKRAIEGVIQAWKEEELIEALKADGITELPEKTTQNKHYVPLQAGGDGRGVYKNDMAEPHFELIESLYSLTQAELKNTEISDDNPRGRAWLQGYLRDAESGKIYPMNFIEIHDEDSRGQYIKLLLATHVPESLIPSADPPPLHPAEKRIMFKQVMEEIDEIATGDLDEFRKAA